MDASNPHAETPSAGPPPDAATLREAALAYLARFATTRRGLEQALERRLRRWGEKAARAGMDHRDIAAALDSLRPTVATIVQDMAGLGAVDDAAFARARARGLTRSGRSRRAVEAHLAQKGVETPVLSDALEEALGMRGDAEAREHEIGAALMLARKRRLGPFAPASAAPASSAPADEKALGVFARNGFSRDVAHTALEMDREDAEAWVDRMRAL